MKKTGDTSIILQLGRLLHELFLQLVSSIHVQTEPGLVYFLESNSLLIEEWRLGVLIAIFLLESE